MSKQFHSIDAIDRQLITLLSENSRSSLVNLSDEIGISRVAIKTRLTNLEQQGVIEKYTLILNPEHLGNSITVSLDLAIEPVHLKEVCEILKDNPHIHKLYQMTGSCSLHGHAMLPDVAEFEVFMHDVIYTLPGLLKADCNTVIARIKDDTEIRV